MRRSWLVDQPNTIACKVPPGRRHGSSRLPWGSSGRAAIAQCVRDAAPALRDGVDADSLATFVLTVMEGGVMQAAAERDIARYDDSVHHLRTYLHMLERIER